MGRHFTLKALPQGKESGMNGILQLNIFLIPLFQKVLGIDIVLNKYMNTDANNGIMVRGKYATVQFIM
jgi:hypothetical protein